MNHVRAADTTKILTRRELTAVLADLRRKAPRSRNTRLNLVLFRLAACCPSGLTKSPSYRLATSASNWPVRICGFAAGRPKGGRPRMVPLWWDAGTLAGLVRPESAD